MFLNPLMTVYIKMFILTKAGIGALNLPHQISPALTRRSYTLYDYHLLFVP